MPLLKLRESMTKRRSREAVKYSAMCQGAVIYGGTSSARSTTEGLKPIIINLYLTKSLKVSRNLLLNQRTMWLIKKCAISNQTKAMVYYIFHFVSIKNSKLFINQEMTMFDHWKLSLFTSRNCVLLILVRPNYSWCWQQ